ncbi:MAG TPA: cation:proton antiporter [Gammaproteobacteria bacterium]
MHEVDLLSNIGVAIVAATLFALVAKSLRQPLLLAYLGAGVFLGPKMGLGLITDEASISLISEIGLILLLFIIGLEIDLKKLLGAGRTLIVSGIMQFIIGVALGLGFFLLLGFSAGGGRFDALYLAIAMALSSTMIVVKILYDKSELATLPGRITLGILIFQDIWAILFLSVQSTLHDPSLAMILLSLGKGAALVLMSFLASRYLLLRVFASISKVPELVLITAIAWCFFVTGVAGEIGLSREMGALIAGVSLSSFPYNVDVIAKVLNIRDFFVTLFFVGLGMQIPMPTSSLLLYALLAALFLVLTRFFAIFPILYSMKCGLRASLIPCINLSQLSEFSLVIAALGLGFHHIDAEVVGILTFVFAITSVLSTYMIQYNEQLQGWLAKGMRRLGMGDLGESTAGADAGAHHHGIVFLGFYREASSVFYEMEALQARGAASLIDKLLVIDINPQVHAELKKRAVACIYGDIASMDTLKHAHIEQAETVVCTIPDTLLRGTSNERLLRKMRRLCPQAQVIVTASTLQAARHLYDEGADFVFIPRLHSARQVAEIIAQAQVDNLAPYREEDKAHLAQRIEVLD